MAAWPKGELGGIAKAGELRIAPLREDGATYRAPTTIWSVAVDGDLYARAFNGLSSRWRKAAIKQKAGRIEAAGMTKDVTFEPAGGAINDRIDAAYRAKYGASPYLAPMIGARATTIKITPRGKASDEG